MQSGFRVAKGLPLDTLWHAEDGSRPLQPHLYLWAKIPSEQYAETVAAIVLDKHNMRTMVPITDDGIEVVTA